MTVLVCRCFTVLLQVDIGRLLQRTPKLLLKPLEQIQADAQQVGTTGPAMLQRTLPLRPPDPTL